MKTSLPRLWPWVLAGLLVAMLGWAYLTPIPTPIPTHPTAADRIWRCQSDLHC